MTALIPPSVPHEDLERHGVPVLLDQPMVGENLQDHLEFYVQYLMLG